MARPSNEMSRSRGGRQAGRHSTRGSARSPARAAAPTPLGALLEATYHHAAGAAGVAIPRDAWRRIVGERIAARTRPRRLDGDTLTIEVATAVWAQELSLLSREIIARLRHHDARVRRLRFRVALVSRTESPTATATQRASTPAPLAALPEPLRAQLAHLEDTELRAILTEACARSLDLRQRAAGRSDGSPRASATSARPDARGQQRVGQGTSPQDRRNPGRRGA